MEAFGHASVAWVRPAAIRHTASPTTRVAPASAPLQVSLSLCIIGEGA